MSLIGQSPKRIARCMMQVHGCMHACVLHSNGTTPVCLYGRWCTCALWTFHIHIYNTVVRVNVAFVCGCVCINENLSSNWHTYRNDGGGCFWGRHSDNHHSVRYVVGVGDDQIHATHLRVKYLRHSRNGYMYQHPLPRSTLHSTRIQSSHICSFMMRDCSNLNWSTIKLFKVWFKWITI